jgi:hypothetical protein
VAAAPVDNAIGITERIGSARGRQWRDRARLPAAVLAIESLIRVVRELDHAIPNRERPAAVLVGARPNAKAVIVVRRDRLGLPVFRHAIEEASSLLFAVEFRSNRYRKWKNCVSPFLYLNRNAIALHLALPSPRRLASANRHKINLSGISHFVGSSRHVQNVP